MTDLLCSAELSAVLQEITWPYMSERVLSVPVGQGQHLPHTQKEGYWITQQLWAWVKPETHTSRTDLVKES